MNFGLVKSLLHPRYRDFQRWLDAAFDKTNPLKSIPWGNTRPEWAEKFRPKIIVDLGCATGKFSSAILERLGAWGCLSDLEQLVLVEEEPGFDSSVQYGIAETVERCRAAIARHVNHLVAIRPLNSPAVIEAGPSKEGAGSRLATMSEDIPAADLLIASHVTYYFPDGGRSLLQALPESLSPDGLAWIVVRKHDCPLYRARSAELHNDVPDGADYAEDLDAAIRIDRYLRLLDYRDWTFLGAAERPSDCVSLAHLLMWRDPLDPSRHDSRSLAAHRACETGEPLFAERHFIIRRA